MVKKLALAGVCISYGLFLAGIYCAGCIYNRIGGRRG
jgi:hypothetical protein